MSEKFIVTEKYPESKANKSRFGAKKAFGIVATAVFAMGALSGCSKEETVSATPESAPQSEITEVVEAPQSMPEEEITNTPEGETETSIYEVSFPNPVVDESIIEVIESAESDHERLVNTIPFYEANGVHLLTKDEVTGENFAQNIVDNYQKRLNLINDSIIAGHGDFAVTIAENSLISSEPAKYINLPSEQTNGFRSTGSLISGIQSNQRDMENGFEVMPTNRFEKVTAYTMDPTNNFEGTFWVEAEGYTFEEPTTFQLIFELRYVIADDENTGDGYIPLFVGGMKDPSENGDLDHNVAGYEREIVRAE